MAATFLACLFALGFGADRAMAQGSGTDPNVPAQVVFQVQYEDKQPSHPTYAETIANVIYPVGKGPVDQGYPAEPLPVLIMVRGGNSNKFGVGELDIDSMAAQGPSMGAIGVSTNLPILGNGDDYHLSAAGVKRLIQYLRHNAANLNVDPDRVILVGRSLGLVVGYAVALQEDLQDLAASDPVSHQSSRPTYYAPRFGPTALHCFSTGIGSWEASLSILFFPGLAFQDVSFPEKWDDSPIHWLLTPERYGRVYTPPLCIASFDASSQPCGQVDDVHSGVFGRISLQAMEDYARATDEWEWYEKRGFVDISITTAEIGIVNWSLERLAEDFDGLYMVPPVGSVLDGAPLEVNCVGGVPGSSVSLYTGGAPASYPISGCPDLEGLIDNAVLVGNATADADGLVNWQLPADPGLLGQTMLLRAVDLGHCEASNLVVHRYY
ncbi:MAG: hypothetical protein ACYS26_15790 [Planctomycetota bacterium]